MKVILLKNVPKVGKKDDIVTVADGYGQNVLLPKKFAILATDHAIANLERTQQNNITQKEIQHSLLDKAINTLAGKTLVYKAKANANGGLFSKLDEHDISTALFEQQHLAIDARYLTIENGPIKKTGTYTVRVEEGKYQNSFSVSVV